MKVSIILAHPDKNSFNNAITGAAAEVLALTDHEVYYHDLVY